MKKEGRREHDEEKEEDREKYSKTQHSTGFVTKLYYAASASHWCSAYLGCPCILTVSRLPIALLLRILFKRNTFTTVAGLRFSGARNPLLDAARFVVANHFAEGLLRNLLYRVFFTVLGVLVLGVCAFFPLSAKIPGH